MTSIVLLQCCYVAYGVLKLTYFHCSWPTTLQNQFITLSYCSLLISHVIISVIIIVLVSGQIYEQAQYTGNWYLCFLNFIVLTNIKKKSEDEFGPQNWSVALFLNQFTNVTIDKFVAL